MNKSKALFSIALIVAFALTALAAGHVSNANAQAATQAPTSVLNVPTQAQFGFGLQGTASATVGPQGILTATPLVGSMGLQTPTAILPVTGGQSAQQQQEILGSNIIGRMAYLQDGVQLGPVSSIIVNKQTGQVDYVVIQLSNQIRNQMNSQLSGQSGAQLGNQNGNQVGQAGQYVPVPLQLIQVLPAIQAQSLQNNGQPNLSTATVVPNATQSSVLPTQSSVLPNSKQRSANPEQRSTDSKQRQQQ